MNNQPRSGYTLPVFACAAAIAALCRCRNQEVGRGVNLNLLEPPQEVEIPIEQVARLNENQALAITCSDPGDNLDLTRYTPIWAVVEVKPSSEQQVIVKGGEGIGRQLKAQGKAAIYDYAQRLIESNLLSLCKSGELIEVTIILPEGRKLAQRTSNAAFGIVEGLSLLGTTGISQPLSTPGQLDIYRQELVKKASQFDNLVFCLGENGLDLARKLGIPEVQLVKTANWLGPMLVEAALQGVNSLLLFGYHGKLIKLAGGIFHTHHHLADGRREIFTAHCAKAGLPTKDIQEIFDLPSTEAGLKYLQDLDKKNGSNWVETVYGAIAAAIDFRSQDYIHKQSNHKVEVGSVLFNRERKIIIKSLLGTAILKKMCYCVPNI